MQLRTSLERLSAIATKVVTNDHLRTMPIRTDWTRSQLLIALNLYHKVAFGKFHANPGS